MGRMTFDFSKHAICRTDREGGLVALDPRRTGDLIEWFDLSHARAYDVRRVLLDRVDRFVFVDHLRRKFTLEPMTLDAWNEIKDNALPAAPAFETTEELLEFLGKIQVY